MALAETFNHSLAQERRFEAARRAEHDAEAARHSGVTWSGMGPGEFRGRSEAEIEAAARDRAARREAFLASPRGRFLKALQSLLSIGCYDELEAVRNEYSRSLADERQPVDSAAVGRCIEALVEIDHSDARAAIRALGELLAGECRRAA